MDGRPRAKCGGDQDEMTVSALGALNDLMEEAGAQDWTLTSVSNQGPDYRAPMVICFIISHLCLALKVLGSPPSLTVALWFVLI